AKRYCPAKGEMICAICCGEKREVTIDCPSDCTHLVAARRWEREHRKPIAPGEVPYPELAIPADLIHERRPLISGLAYTILKAAMETPALDDSGAIEALAALAEMFRTLGTGLYYERSPDAPLARSVYEKIGAFLQDVKKAETQNTGFGGLRDSEAFRVLAFLLRVAKYETNGRPRSRAFLDFLRAQFPRTPETQPETSRIIVP
ncbi:MAG: hypothetical protein WA002_13575, partial [Candidatus Acidiferrales bacterium]